LLSVSSRWTDALKLSQLSQLSQPIEGEREILNLLPRACYVIASAEQSGILARPF